MISGEREFPIPEHVDIFFLRKEIDACDKTALEAVMDVDAERIFLENKAEELSGLGRIFILVFCFQFCLSYTLKTAITSSLGWGF